MFSSLFGKEKETVCRADIFSATKKEYGEDYKKDLFEQYKLFIESVNYISDLKIKINSYFLTINTALITVVVLFISKSALTSSLLWHLIMPFAGIIISLIWFGVTYSYKERSTAKHRIIHCIEEKLPLAVYATEWHIMEERHSGPFKNFFFRIDLFIPLVFAASYLFFIIFV